jgi:hypothetical protein
MTAANVLIYVALIGYILYLRVRGRPVKEGRGLFVLPVLLIVLGSGDVTRGASAKPLEVVLTVVAGAISLGLGLMRGRVDKLSERNGAPFVQWGAASLLLFVGNLVTKLILDAIGLAAGSAGSTVGRSLVLTLGLTLLGEAIVLWMRTAGRSRVSNPPTPAPTPEARWSNSGHDSEVNEPVAVAASGAARNVGRALAGHHERHRQRHQYRHDRSHR